MGRVDGKELGPTEIDGSLDAVRLGSEDGDVLGLDDSVGSTLGKTEGRFDGDELGIADAVGLRLGSTDGWEETEGRVVGEGLGRFEIEGSLDFIRLGTEEGDPLGPLEGVALGLAEGLKLGRTEGIEVDGEIDGALELLIVGTGEGAFEVGRAVGRAVAKVRLATEGAGVTFFFLRFQRGRRRQPSASFLPLSFFFRSASRFFRHFFRPWSPRPRLGRSSWRFFCHFLRTLSRRLVGRW